MPAEPVSVFDFEAIARETLSGQAYDYYAGGAQDEVTLRENRAAYDRLALAYRVMVDVSRRDLTASVLGQPVAMPILVAPPRSIASRLPKASWPPPAPPERRGRS